MPSSFKYPFDIFLMNFDYFIYKSINCLDINIYTNHSPTCSKNQSNKKVSFWKKEIEKGPQVYPPNNTVYIHNLNEKVPIDELKDTLLNTF